MASLSFPIEPIASLAEIDESEPESELLYGWRGMSLTKSENRPMLKGVIHVWPEREMVAVCDPRVQPLEIQEVDPEGMARLHLSNDNCRCGIYALKKINIDMLAYPVLALCVLDGVLVEATKGYRAERVRIEQLWWNPAAAARGSIRPDSVDFLWAFKDYDIPWQIGLPPIDNIESFAHPLYEDMKGKLGNYGHWRDYQKTKDREAGEAAAERAFVKAFASGEIARPGSASDPRPGSSSSLSTDVLTSILQQAGCVGRRCTLATERDIELRATVFLHTDGKASPDEDYLVVPIGDRELRKGVQQAAARVVTELRAHHARTDAAKSASKDPPGYSVQQLQKEQRSMLDRLRGKR